MPAIGAMRLLEVDFGGSNDFPASWCCRRVAERTVNGLSGAAISAVAVFILALAACGVLHRAFDVKLITPRQDGERSWSALIDRIYAASASSTFFAFSAIVGGRVACAGSSCSSGGGK